MCDLLTVINWHDRCTDPAVYVQIFRSNSRSSENSLTRFFFFFFLTVYLWLISQQAWASGESVHLVIQSIGVFWDGLKSTKWIFDSFSSGVISHVTFVSDKVFQVVLQAVWTGESRRQGSLRSPPHWLPEGRWRSGPCVMRPEGPSCLHHVLI